MSYYLVLARCGMDDVPMAICQSMEDAMNLARGLTQEDVERVANDVLSCPVSTHVCISILTFENGLPVDCMVARDWDDVEACRE